MFSYSNSISEQPSHHADIVRKITLTELKNKLEHGPIFIGEAHSKPFARAAIKSLIKAGCVKKLFLEFPNMDNEDDKDIQDAAIYLSSASRDLDEGKEFAAFIAVNGSEEATKIATKSERPFPMWDLIKAALDQGEISIYFHDSPRGSRNTVIIDGIAHPLAYITSIEGVRGRNKDSAHIIKRNNFGAGTVILAGIDHLDSQAYEEVKPEITLGEKNTLQHLLGCENDVVFDLSNLTEELQ